MVDIALVDVVWDTLGCVPYPLAPAYGNMFRALAAPSPSRKITNLKGIRATLVKFGGCY